MSTRHKIKASRGLVELLKQEAYPRGLPLTDYLGELSRDAETDIRLARGRIALSAHPDVAARLVAVAKALDRPTWEVILELHLRRRQRRRKRLQPAASLLVSILEQWEIETGSDPVMAELVDLLDRGMVA